MKTTKFKNPRISKLSDIKAQVLNVLKVLSEIFVDVPTRRLEYLTNFLSTVNALNAKLEPSLKSM